MCREIENGGRRCNGGEGGNARRRMQYAAQCARDMLAKGKESRFLRHVRSMRASGAVMREHGVEHEPQPLPDDHLIEAARIVATDAHEGQFRRDGRPYIVHPAAVAEKLEEAGLPPHVVSAGWLHDVVEDTDYTLEDLRLVGFPQRTTGIVRSVTHEEGESYLDDSMARAVETLDSAAVKDADNQHNTSDRRGPTPAQYAKQMKRNEKYLEARRIIKRRLYETPDGQAELERQFAALD